LGGSAERSLGVDDPIVAVQLLEQLFKRARIAIANLRLV
jgi:hypothetical protein